MRGRVLTLTALLLAAAASFAGCRSSFDEAASTTPIATAETSATTTAMPPSPPETPSSSHHPDTTAAASTTTTPSRYEGTRDNPVPLGYMAQVGPWSVRVLEATFDADDIVYNHSEFNERPQVGHQYVLVKIEAMRTGEEATAFWTDTYYEFIGSDGDTFEVGYADIPDAISDTVEADPGASISGNLLFEVSSDQVTGGTVRFSEAFSFEDVEVYFAVD